MSASIGLADVILYIGVLGGSFILVDSTALESLVKRVSSVLEQIESRNSSGRRDNDLGRQTI